MAEQVNAMETERQTLLQEKKMLSLTLHRARNPDEDDDGGN